MKDEGYLDDEYKPIISDGYYCIGCGSGDISDGWYDLINDGWTDR